MSFSFEDTKLAVALCRSIDAIDARVEQRIFCLGNIYHDAEIISRVNLEHSRAVLKQQLQIFERSGFEPKCRIVVKTHK